MTPDTTPPERAALLAWHFAHGDAMRTRDAAKLLGVSWDAAKKMLCGISRVIPITQDDRGFWMAMEAMTE